MPLSKQGRCPPPLRDGVPPGESISVAVLPFENLSSDPEQDFFADSLATTGEYRLSYRPRLRPGFGICKRPRISAVLRMTDRHPRSRAVCNP
jgi:hypothetical protein